MPKRGGRALVLAHLVGEAVALEHRACLVGVEPDRRRELDQRLAVADRPALGEVGSAMRSSASRLQPVLAARWITRCASNVLPDSARSRWNCEAEPAAELGHALVASRPPPGVMTLNFAREALVERNRLARRLRDRARSCAR